MAVASSQAGQALAWPLFVRYGYLYKQLWYTSTNSIHCQILHAWLLDICLLQPCLIARLCMTKILYCPHTLSGRCQEAGFTACCSGSAGDCGVGTPGDQCFCDSGCFYKGDCCSDVVAIGCRPGNYTAQSYTWQYIAASNIIGSTALVMTCSNASAIR